MTGRQIPKAARDEAYRLAAETELSQVAIAARVGADQSTVSRWFWVKFKELLRKEGAEALREGRQIHYLDAARENLAHLTASMECIRRRKTTGNSDSICSRDA